MAENKKSFVLYCDLIHTVEKLSDQEAGELFKVILRYVNDKNPQPKKRSIDLTFEPIKQNLKRDLKEWEGTRTKRSEAGKRGGIKSGESRRREANEANASNASTGEANEAVNVNGNVTVNVNGTVSLWDNIKQNFLNDFRWKEKFCTQKGISITDLELQMKDFITDLELKENYKPLDEIKNHFTNFFNKNKNGSTNNSKSNKHTGAGQLLTSLKLEHRRE